MTPLALDAAWVLPHPGRLPARQAARVLIEDGLVVSINDKTNSISANNGEHAHDGASPDSGASIAFPLSSDADSRIVVPALANAHDHARGWRQSALGLPRWPLESWLPTLSLVPGIDPYLVAAASFARSLRGGVTAAMVHYTRWQGVVDPVFEALAVARAARDVGLRIAFAPSLRDRQPLAYCDSERVLAALRPDIRAEVGRRLAAPMPSVSEQLARAHAIAASLETAGLSSTATFQYGPTGVQWCSDELLKAIAEASASTGRSVHMHLLETRYQREWADQNYPEGVVTHLDRIGLLSERLTLAHCTWARPEELALLAERDVTIAVNTSSNLTLKSGIAPVSAMLEAGCRVAVGLDGMAFDEDDDVLREMRLTGALHRGWGYEEVFDDGTLWEMAAVNGRRAILGKAGSASAAGGTLAPGQVADCLILDRAGLDDRLLGLPLDPTEVLFSRGQAAQIRDVIAGGRIVVEAGRVCGIDEGQIRSALREAVQSAISADANWPQWRNTLVALGEDLGPFHRAGAFLGCCG
jgi:5-methylthioadenosine/S-adenosylhomocysteine deaminase